MPDRSWPVLLVGGSYVADVDGTTNGRLVGVIHSFDYELFEAWRFTSKQPKKIKAEPEPNSFDQALALFYRRDPVLTSPPAGWLRRRVRRQGRVIVGGKPQWLPSVRWCGIAKARPCACYSDGLVEAHKFTWQGWEIILRQVLVDV